MRLAWAPPRPPSPTPAELRHCSTLRELNLEGNRLTTPVLDLRCMTSLQSLQLFGNPLEYLPELNPCSQLRSLSLANVRIMADSAFTRCVGGGDRGQGGVMPGPA